MDNTLDNEDLQRRMWLDNGWWLGEGVPKFYRTFKPRLYFSELYGLVTQEKFNRSVVLMGPRRVGKTVLLHHVIQRLLTSKHADNFDILYLSLETPIYQELSLEALFNAFQRQRPIGSAKTCYVFFDEIQYLPDWEVHLKSLTDTYREVQFVVSGSAAAALRLKSRESGAGRFTDFDLPPLTFHEYLNMRDRLSLIRPVTGSWNGKPIKRYDTPNVQALNQELVRYINWGSYPEIVNTPLTSKEASRYLKDDVVAKVLSRDLPNLYGITNPLELNRLLLTLAINTGGEVNTSHMARDAKIELRTLQRYLDYLEAAYLIHRIPRIDEHGKAFKRNHHLKVYLTNPAMYAGLLTPVEETNHALMGQLVETAIYAQWYHRKPLLAYARWRRGEVDIIGLKQRDRTPGFAVEVKWSDRFVEQPKKLKGLIGFAKQHQLERVVFTTITKQGSLEVDGITLEYLPASLYCYTVGRRTFEP